MEKDSIILQKARQVLIDEGWCQGSLMNDQGQFCSLGALGVSAFCINNDSDAFLKAVVDSSIVTWNDDPKRTFEEILQAFDEATSMAMGEEDVNDK